MENNLNHNPKQTAVNWVVGEIIKHQMSYYGNASIPLYILEKAIQMEKQQIIDACWAGGDDGEQYYNETYGGNK